MEQGKKKTEIAKELDIGLSSVYRILNTLKDTLPNETQKEIIVTDAKVYPRIKLKVKNDYSNE